MGIASTLRTALLADSAITDIVGAKVLTAEDVGREGLKWSDLESDSSPIAVPTIYINMVEDAPHALITMNAHQVSCDIYCYQHSGYNHTAALRTAIRNLLHLKALADGDVRYWFIRQRDFVERKDRTFKTVPSMEMSRYQVIYMET